MNLRSLVDTLERMPADAPVRFDSGIGVRGLGSWRGVYAELTLYHCDERFHPDPITVAGLLLEAHDALNGKVFDGYKGGDFVMHEGTAVWGDDYGDYGCHGVMGAALTDGVVVLATADLSEYR